MPKETSEQVSSLASSYLNFTGDDLVENIGNALVDQAQSETEKDQLAGYCAGLAQDIRTLAASCLSQDETSETE